MASRFLTAFWHTDMGNIRDESPPTVSACVLLVLAGKCQFIMHIDDVVISAVQPLPAMLQAPAQGTGSSCST